MNAVADALVILVRAALAFVLALGLLVFAIYAAGAHIGTLLTVNRLKAEGGDRVHKAAQR